MLAIDRPFEGLDEVWMWSIPHPADPEEPAKSNRVTRIGTLEGGRLVGLVQVRTRPSRTILGAVDELEGLGPWRKEKLGKVSLHRTGDTRGVTGAHVTSGPVDAEWRPGGRFRVGGAEEVNKVATGGGPFAPSVRDLGESALELGRSLLRKVRDRDGETEREIEVETETETVVGVEVGEPGALSAFDGWLVATPGEVAGEPAWRVAVDRRPGAPESVGLGLVVAAIGLLHRRG